MESVEKLQHINSSVQSLRTSQSKPIVISKLNQNFENDRKSLVMSKVKITKVNQEAINEYGDYNHQAPNVEDLDAKKKKI
jgi:hypothetical protein